MDNFNMHKRMFLYKAIPTALAGGIIKPLESHCTLKHASWMAMAEIRLNDTTRQCLVRCIGTISLLRNGLSTWETEWN